MMLYLSEWIIYIKSSSNIESNLFFLLVKRLMNKKDKDGESKNTMSVVVSKIVCTARSSGHTFSGKLKLIFISKIWILKLSK